MNASGQMLMPAEKTLTRPANILALRTGEGCDEFISKKELAARLKVNVRTIERWQHDDLLPYFKVGTVVLFNWPEVVERLKTNFKVGSTKTEGLPQTSTPHPGPVHEPERLLSAW